MIYTVTFNPSLDYIVKLPTLELGSVNRTAKEELYSRVAKDQRLDCPAQLGVESTALGFTAGFTGAGNPQAARCMWLPQRFYPSAGRVFADQCQNQAEQESEINGQGPYLSPQNLQDLFAIRISIEHLSDGDGLVLAGSIPNTLPADIYEKILERLQDRNIHAVVDATGELLRNVLKYRPFLIKPNNHELGELFGQRLTTDEAIISHAQKLQQMGARNVPGLHGGRWSHPGG